MDGTGFGFDDFAQVWKLDHSIISRASTVLDKLTRVDRASFVGFVEILD